MYFTDACDSKGEKLIYDIIQRTFILYYVVFLISHLKNYRSLKIKIALVDILNQLHSSSCQNTGSFYCTNTDMYLRF